MNGSPPNNMLLRESSVFGEIEKYAFPVDPNLDLDPLSNHTQIPIPILIPDTSLILFAHLCGGLFTSLVKAQGGVAFETPCGRNKRT